MKRATLAAGRISLVLTTLAAALCACTLDSLPSDPAPQQPVSLEPETPAPDPAPAMRTPDTPSSVRRGLGTLSARVPGTDTIVGGVHLVSHHVRAVARDGYARTEIEEEFYNDTSTVLEGRFTFPLPPEASISRLALYVGATLVEGEIVEKRIAARIFRDIVDDTVRPRDPALLEWMKGSEFSLKIFPLPPRASRRVILAYDHVLPTIDGRIEYTYPLSLGQDRANTIRDFSFDLTAMESAAEITSPSIPRQEAEVTTEPHKLVVRIPPSPILHPQSSSDILVSYVRGTYDHPSMYMPLAGEFGATASPDGYVAFRVGIGRESENVSQPRDLVIVLDRSYSQSADTLAAQATLAEAALRDLADGESFALLACDSTCSSFPEQGLARAETRTAARAWLDTLQPRGSSDAAGALLQALRRASGGAQLVWLTDGQPTSGELTAASMADHVRPALSGAQLRIVGAGRTVDEEMLRALARSLGATYDRLALQDAAASPIVRKLRGSVLTDVVLELPDGLHDAYPRSVENLAPGDELLVVGRAADGFHGGVARVRGLLQGRPHSFEQRIAEPGARDNPLVPRLWAQAALANLEAGAPMVALSRSYHVLSRATSLLVLENDAMFSSFGIAHPTRSAASQSDAQFVGEAPRAAFGSMMGDPIADEYGPDGPVYHGRGRGRRAFGEEGSMAPPRVPRVRMGATTVSGRLPPEIVQRVVRQHFGRLRTCYERGLSRNPDLAGRVTVRFVIGRDGSVVHASVASSELADNDAVGCMVATFRAMQFPQPEGGIITVTYPVVYSSDGTRPQHPPSPWPVPPQPDAPAGPEPRAAVWQAGPVVVYRPLDETWRDRGAAELAALHKALLANERSRSGNAALVRGLLRFGNFDEALEAAKRFASMDPELPRARELLAQALAAVGSGAEASWIVDSLVETAPSDAAAHARAARAFEAWSAERPACAHWRTLAQLRPRDGAAVMQSLRCRARVLGESEQVLRELTALPNNAAGAGTLAYQVRNGTVPAYDGSYGATPAFEATVTCGQTPAPSVVLLTDTGHVIAPTTPSVARTSATGLGMAVSHGTIRTLLTGGGCEGGELELRAYGVVRKFALGPGEGTRSIALTTIRNES